MVKLADWLETQEVEDSETLVVVCKDGNLLNRSITGWRMATKTVQNRTFERIGDH